MQATQNVLRHYSIETTQKGADFIALTGVVSMIVGTRVAAYNMRRRMERQEANRSGARMTSNVVRMPQASVAPGPAPGPGPAPSAPKSENVSTPIQTFMEPGPIDENGTGF